MERIFVKVIEARGLGDMSMESQNEPNGYYVDLGYRDSKQRFTTIVKNQDEPFWNQDFIFGLSKDGSNTILFRIFNKQSELIAESEMALNLEQTTTMQDDWIPLHLSKKKKSLSTQSLRQGERGELHVSIQYGRSQAGPASKAAAPQTSSQTPPSFKSLEVRRPLAQPQPKYPIHQFTSKFMPDMYGNFDPRRELLVDSPADRYR